jgi:hypothetical protein
MELKMPNETPDQKHEPGHQTRTLVLPHAETDLDASMAHTDRQRPTSNDSQASHDRGLVVTLWLFALLIAEIEFWTLAFTHMYRM